MTDKKIGRPSRYSVELTDLICDRLKLGESLSSICRDKEMPHQATIYDWLKLYEDFGERYARAREIGFELLAEQIIEIADQDTPTLQNGGIDNGAVQKQRLQIDTRKWILAKQLPKKYGDKIDLNHKGSIGLNINIDIGDKEND